MRFMLEDSIMAEGKVSSAGSAILYNFTAPFSSMVYEKCIEAGFEFCGNIVSDEFGIDSLFDETDDLSPCIEVLLEEKCDIILCNDIFGKLRRQAPLNGLMYILPSYGVVSRYGLIPSVSSMDRIGILCKNVADGSKALSVIRGYDRRDGTSAEINGYKKVEKTGALNLLNIGCNKLKAIDLEPKYFNVLPQVFYILAAAEISNNTNRYDGVKFGLRSVNAGNINDLYFNTRSEGFKKDMKLASLVGCMVLSQQHYEKLYHKSMQIRRLIKDYYDDIFKQIDAIALPVQTDENKYKQSALYALASLCGYTSVSFQCGDKALQLVCRNGNESGALSFIEEVSK